MSARGQNPFGRRLREMYDNVVREDVPPEFLNFLRMAEARDGVSAPDDPDADDLPDEDDSRDDPLGVKPLPHGPKSGPRMDTAAVKPERDPAPLRLVVRQSEPDQPA